MTTGDPLVVRGAMKPLPTLTKPLRSVDIATKEPAQALRERTDSCTVPAAGVVAEAMVALVLAGAYRDKFGGDHIDDVLAARSTPTASGSGGGASGRSRASRRRRSAGARSCSSASWAPASRAPRGRSPPSWAWQPSTRDRELERELGEPIERLFDREGEAAFRAREEELVLRLLRREDLRGGRARRRRARRPRRCAWRSSATWWCTSTWTRPRPGAARRARAARWRATRTRFDAALPATAGRVYEAVADALLPPADRGARRAGAAGAARRCARRRWARGSSGRWRPRATTRCSSAAACSSRASSTPRRGAGSW